MGERRGAERMGKGTGAEALCLDCGTTKFLQREKVRVANRTKREIYEEITTTATKLAVFVLAFYAIFYVLAMVMSAILDSDIDGKACDWSTDRGQVVGISTVGCYLAMIIVAVFVVREGDSKVCLSRMPAGSHTIRLAGVRSCVGLCSHDIV